MPELPDVELFKRLAEQCCIGKTIADLKVADPKLLKGVSPAALQRQWRNKKLRAAHRHGKVLFLEADSAGTLAMHFGMNGSLQSLADNEEEPPFVRLTLAFTDGHRLAYLNPRRIGHVMLISDANAYIAEEGLGPDALSPAFDYAAFTAALDGKRQAIKAVLMDQTCIAGIGNIYADEILFQAKLYPLTSANALDEAAKQRLFKALKWVLQTAVDYKAGAEIFTDRLPKGFLIPERHAGGKCPRCGAAILSFKLGGRSGYYCPRCQPEPDG
ncbi:MAG: hypothetical protein K6U10_14010 [Acidobacteriia bacterium]|nr:hypothetical protein [Methyloceanibacter sp.]MCL6492916.1 hypothetical protein [Terriglobia bacterium]